MTRYELRINGGYIEEFDSLEIPTLDQYNQVVIDNPDDKVELVKISETVVRTTDR